MTRRFILVGALLLATCGWIVRAQVAVQHHPPESAEAYIKVLEDPGRDEWQRPDVVVDRLDLRQGDEVADIGAGSGYFTVRLARVVGPQGKVYAVDIDQKLLDYINARAEKEHLDNIQTILADPKDPNLGSASVDMIFICDTLHHIEHRNAYYQLLLRALRPSGRLVNIDFQKRSLPVGPPVEMKIDRKACIKEVEAAGFHLLRDIQFLKYQYFLIFEREG
jgi:ubiquinone/menaquinone biosynthesis C-methylase UbiE